MYLVPAIEQIFVRPPKTGSIALFTAFQKKGPVLPVGPTHARVCDLSDEKIEELSGFEFTSVVRHPYTWLPSFRAHLERFRCHNDRRLIEQSFTRHRVPSDWESFIRELRWTPADYWTDPRVEVGILKLEDLNYIPKVNKASHAKKPLDLTPAIERLIEDRFHRELDFYR